jgi:hypothetical protein
MAKKDGEMLSLQRLASIPPVLPVISDHPLEKETAGQDKFDLCYQPRPPRPSRRTSRKTAGTDKSGKSEIKKGERL